jgi:hypothetical protein
VVDLFSAGFEEGFGSGEVDLAKTRYLSALAVF